MGTKLVVDLSALGAAADRLAIIAADFATTDERIEGLSAAMGNKNETHRLRHETEAFGGRWRSRREELRGSVEYLAQMASDVATNLGAVDTDLTTQLTEQPAPVITSTRPQNPGAV